MNGHKKISVKIPEGLFEEMKKIMEKRGYSQSEFIRDAIREKIDNEKKTLKDLEGV